MAMVHGLNLQGEVIPKEKLRGNVLKPKKGLTVRPGPPYICPECSKYRHRKVEFQSPHDLGRHRRFTHQILGQSSTALKSRRLTLENRIKAGEAEVASPQPKKEKFQCADCSQSFTTQRGLSHHATLSHRAPQEIVPDGSYGKENGIVRQTNGQAYGQNIADATAQALVISYATGVAKGVISAIAESHDFLARQLTERVARALLAETKR